MNQPAAGLHPPVRGVRGRRQSTVLNPPTHCLRRSARPMTRPSFRAITQLGQCGRRLTFDGRALVGADPAVGRAGCPVSCPWLPLAYPQLPLLFGQLAPPAQSASFSDLGRGGQECRPALPCVSHPPPRHTPGVVRRRHAARWRYPGPVRRRGKGWRARRRRFAAVRDQLDGS